MRAFMGVSFPIKFALPLILALSVRPFDLMGSSNRPLLLTEAIVSRAMFGTVYGLFPEGLAVLEHVSGRDLLGIGDCRISAVRALGPDGRLLVGTARRHNGTVTPHVWGVSPEGRRVDLSCPACPIVATQAALTIEDYTVTNVQILAPDVPGLAMNIRYLRAALPVEKVRALLGLSTPQEIPGGEV